MALSDYTPERTTVPFANGEFQVRGLSIGDVATLVKNHLPDLDNLVEVFTQSQSQNDDAANTAQVDEIVRHAIGAIKTAPALVAHTIALACDEPDSVDNARQLPIPVQIQAIREIADLTFSEAGGPKKFLASLADLIVAITDKPTGLHT